MQNQIKKIEFKNLFSYGNKWQSFSPEGICFITGHNKNNDRRNFTGKSSLLRVFPFALYGKVEGLNKSRIINWKNRGKAESYITVQKGNDEYVLHRGIKPDILEVTKNGKELPKPANKKDFQQQIEDEILQMDYTSFMQTVYADNSNESILNMSKPNKRQFLENIFDLHYYTNLRNKANKKNTAIDSNISNLKTVITETEQRIQDAEKLQRDYQQEIDNLPDSTVKLQEKQQYLNNNEEVYKNALKKVDDLNKEESFLNEEYHEIDNTKTKIKYKIKELTNKHIVKEQVLDNVDDVNQQIEQKKQTIKDNQSEIQQKQDDISKFANDLEAQKDFLIDELTNLQAEYKHAKHQYNEASKKIENKVTDAKCPTCFQEVDHELIEQHLKEEQDRWYNNKGNTKVQVDEKKIQLSEVKREIINKQELEEAVRKLQDEVKTDEEQVTKLQEQVAEIEEKQERAKKSAKYEKIIEKLTKLFESYLYKHKQMKQQSDRIANEIEKLEPVISDYEQYEKEIDKLKISVENEKEQKDKLQQWIQDAKDKQQELSGQIEDSKKKISRMNNMKDYIDYVKDICSDEKGRAYSISQKIPLLNQRTNHYLSKAGVNYYIKLNNWLDVEIKGPGIKDCTYQNLSGAEKVSLDRGLQFALHDINKLQSPSYFDLLILDEVIGSNSLDQQGIENMLNIIKAKQKEDKSNMLIVSHDEATREAEGLIDNSYVIEFDGKYSYINKQ
ncbi:hypothetical protein AKJ59_00150 [candidate division MSBL1 archaeon SCGC-AAA385M02]|uniref:Rad50/SbcC-type AAA domain-containing protein n=1 Tax=candidate division MSBL1 archaeon SCGC-AAA385M02 TaxID=1698287 RepID=A0A133VR62_9EURY|nr:hypothetical protein AKJ59_00150 [candidate division MSBL1 archaeon SCGC-AAA385M02]